MTKQGYVCDKATGGCVARRAWEERNGCLSECAPQPESDLLRINCVYYTANGASTAGTDFKMLVGLGVNVLSMSFYKPDSTHAGSCATAWERHRPASDLLCPSGGAWNVTDPVGMGGLVQKWGNALEENNNQRGHIYISLGGANEDTTWTAPFTRPVEFAKDLIAIHKSITPHFTTKNSKLGFDLDIEDPGAEAVITKGFLEFITTLRDPINGLTPDECPMQVDSFSSVFSEAAGDHFLFDIIKLYGPKGTSVPNGFQYQGLMVDSGPSTGNRMKDFWDNAAWNGESILPYTSRVVNFWHDANAGLFVSDADNLFSWIKNNNVSVGWWRWDAELQLLSGDVNHMFTVCTKGDFGSGNFTCSNPALQNTMPGHHCE